MAIHVKDDGGLEIIYGQKWTGLNTQAPSNLIADTDAAAMSNFMLRNGTLSTRPTFVSFANAFGAGDFPTAVGSFLDTTNVWRTFAITFKHNLYQLNLVGPIPTWQLVGNLVVLTGSAQPAWQTFNNTLYWVDGTQHSFKWTGAATTTDVFTVGGVAIGAFYMGSLAQHMLLAYTVEGGAYFPNRIRWSATGLPEVFDPAININAGSNDIIDIVDSITGIMMLGRVGFIFHKSGIMEVSPTGIGTAPFDFNHIWNANDGMGNVYPYTVCQYGSTGAFASIDNIYLVQNYQFQAIGGNSRDAIMADMATYFSIPDGANLAAGPANQPIMAIVPGYSNGYTYLTVQVILPYFGGTTVTRIYEYSIEGGYWERYDIGTVLSAKPFMCFANQGAF